MIYCLVVYHKNSIQTMVKLPPVFPEELLFEQTQILLTKAIFAELPEEVNKYPIIKLASDFTTIIRNAAIVSQNLVQGGKNFYMVGNYAFGGAGVIIAGESTLKWFTTKNILARFFYATSTVCGGTSAIAGFYTGTYNPCQISFLSVGGDIIGGSLYFFGRRTQYIGDLITQKKQWWKPNNFLFKICIILTLDKQI